jgi:hypothetical protein
MSNSIYEVEEALCRELDSVVEDLHKDNGKLSPNAVNYVDKLLHAVKSVKTIEAMEGGSQRGRYSNNGGSYYDGGYNRSRDSRGRYMHGDMSEKLMDLMESTDDPQIKQELKRLMDRV